MAHLKPKNQKTSLSKGKCLKLPFYEALDAPVTDYSSEPSFHVLLRGSFTLEAAVLLPLFAAFLVSILFFFKVLIVQENLTEAMELSARKASTAAFAERYGVDGDVAALGSLGAAIAFTMKEYEEKAGESGFRYLFMDHAGLNLTVSEVKEDHITLRAYYVMKLPVELLGKKTFLMGQTVKARRWSGYQISGDASSEEDDIWVYVTPYGTVYHMDRNCSYLKPSVSSVSASEVGKKRNKDGSRYTPCALCGKRKTAGGLYYITNYGTNYHTDLTCSGLKRGISMIRLSEAGGYGACSKCAH